MSNVKHATVENFEELVLKSEKPVLVDFWAPWCGPCKMIAPILDDLSVEKNDVEIVKIDVDAQPDLAQKYKVRGIPTLILFKNGSVEATKTGALNKSGLNSFIENNI
jgi:thioredoxin 1